MERNIPEKSFTLQYPKMPEAQNSIDFDSYEDLLILVNQCATELHSKSSDAFDINKNGVYHRCPAGGQKSNFAQFSYVFVDKWWTYIFWS